MEDEPEKVGAYGVPSPNRQQFSAETNGMLLPLTHVSLHLSMARNISWKQDNEKVVTKYMVTF